MYNKAVLDIVNNGKDTMIFKLEDMIGIIDFRVFIRLNKAYYKRT